MTSAELRHLQLRSHLGMGCSLQMSQERARAAQAAAVPGPAGPVPPQHAATDLPRFVSHR